MTTNTNDPRLASAYRGRFDGVRYACSPARYGKGMVLQLTRDASDMWKDRASWLAEALNGRWARGHQEGFRISTTRAWQWRVLFLAGWDAHVPIRWAGTPKKPATFSLNHGPELTLAEAMKKAGVYP